MILPEILLSTKEYFSIVCERKEIPSQQRAPEVVLFIQQKGAFAYLEGQYPHKKGSGFLSKMAFFEGGKIGVCSGFGLGGPALAARQMELIAWGVRRFIYIGVATPLSSDIAHFTLVIPNKMYGEGLCQHLFAEKEGGAIPEVWKRDFYAFCSKEGHYPRPVTGYSSDFFLAPKLSSAGSFKELHGLDILDMNSAAFYATGQSHEVDFLSLLVTSDCLCDEEWIASKDPDALLKTLKIAVDLSYGFCLEVLP